MSPIEFEYLIHCNGRFGFHIISFFLYAAINSVTPSELPSIVNTVTKSRKKNYTTLQICTTLHQRITTNENMGEERTQKYFLFTKKLAFKKVIKSDPKDGGLRRT
jgi:hypothetical protein